MVTGADGLLIPQDTYILFKETVFKAVFDGELARYFFSVWFQEIKGEVMQQQVHCSF